MRDRTCRFTKINGGLSRLNIRKPDKSTSYSNCQKPMLNRKSHSKPEIRSMFQKAMIRLWAYYFQKPWQTENNGITSLKCYGIKKTVYNSIYRENVFQKWIKFGLSGLSLEGMWKEVFQAEGKWYQMEPSIYTKGNEKHKK